MNRVLAFVTAAVIATPLFAATNPKPISSTEAAPVTDSPLVAAAKRAGRLGKKPTNVITNESLAKTGGHVTTTQQQTSINMPAPAPVQQTTQATTTPAPAVSNAAKEKKAEEQRQKAINQVEAQYEGDSADDDHDPARQEQQMKTLQTPPPPGDKKH